MADRETTRRIAWLALFLFIGGLLLPLVIYPLLCYLAGLPHRSAINLASAFWAICELLALILGVVGRRQLPGRIAAIGSGLVIALVVFAIAAFVFR